MKTRLHAKQRAVETPDAAPPDDQLLDIDAVLKRVPVAPRTLLDWRRKGLFPQPISVGRSRFWMASEIDAWLEARRAARDADYGALQR